MTTTNSAVKVIRIDHPDWVFECHLEKPTTSQEVDRIMGLIPSLVTGPGCDWELRHLCDLSLRGWHTYTKGISDLEALSRFIDGEADHFNGLGNNHGKIVTEVPEAIIREGWERFFRAHHLTGRIHFTVRFPEKDKEEVYIYRLHKVSREDRKQKTYVASEPGTLEQDSHCPACQKALKKGGTFWEARITQFSSSTVLQRFTFCSYRCEQDYQF